MAPVYLILTSLVIVCVSTTLFLIGLIDAGGEHLGLFLISLVGVVALIAGGLFLVWEEPLLVNTDQTSSGI